MLVQETCQKRGRRVLAASPHQLKRPQSGFDYGDLPSDVADRLPRHTAGVKRNVANALPYLVEAGAELAKAHDRLRHNKRGGSRGNTIQIRRGGSSGILAGAY